MPCSVLSCAGHCQTHSTRWPQSRRNPIPQPRGTRSRFARSPGSPLCRTMQDPFPDERFLPPSATRAVPPRHFHLRRMPEEHAAAGAARSRADPPAPRPARAGSDPSPAWVPVRTPAGCWVLPCTSSPPAPVLQELPEGQGLRHTVVPCPTQGREGSEKVQNSDQNSCLCQTPSPAWRIGEALPPAQPRAPQGRALQSPKGCEGLARVPGERWGRSCSPWASGCCSSHIRPDTPARQKPFVSRLSLCPPGSPQGRAVPPGPAQAILAEPGSCSGLSQQSHIPM